MARFPLLQLFPFLSHPGLTQVQFACRFVQGILLIGASASERVPDGSCQVMFRLFSMINVAICTVKDDGSGQVVVDRVLAQT